MMTGIIEDFYKVKSLYLASNSNFIFKFGLEIIIQANYKEKIMERILWKDYLIHDIVEDLKGLDEEKVDLQ